MILINKVLKERYKLTELIAEGGMASVYKGVDLLLQRTVAIKVLKQNLALDKDGIERFYREARSAAKLSHTNIVNIYDIGSEEQIYFIVMEYLSGGTLDRLEKPLSIKEIINIAIEICEALTFAHQKGLVHRDIKPQNIMFTESQKIKVVDFGIARPLDSATMTSPGTIIGSVYYFSPEQAEGKEVGNLSDIYSTGVLLYYLATARYPFDGENAVSIALKHINEIPTPPKKLNPKIPPKLEEIILKAMKKVPEERHKSAAAMLKEIKTLQEKLYKKTEAIDKGTLEKLKNFSNEEETLVRKGPPPSGKKEEADKDEKRIHPLILILILGLIIIIGVPTGMMISSMNKGPAAKSELIEVPYLIGKTQEEAQKQIASLKLITEILRENNDKIPEGQVISQTPPGGTMMERENIIKLTISIGKEEILIPYLIGKTIKEATKELSQIGIELIVVEEEGTDKYPPDTIIAQEPRAGEKIKEDRQIKVKISTEPEKIEVPDLVGLTEKEALKILERKGLTLKILEEKNSIMEKGLIIEQKPEGNMAIQEGEEISVIISSGPIMITVPDITGLTIPQGKEFLKELSLTIRVMENEFYEVDSSIIKVQSPAPGEKLPEEGIIEVGLKSIINEIMVIVPDVTGKLLFDAKNKLSLEKLKTGIISEALSDKVPGTVLLQEPPPGTEVKENTEINLTVSKLEEKNFITVPNLIETNIEEAGKNLEKAGLKIGSITEMPSNKPSGIIIEQNPPPGTEVKGNTKIDLVIARGESEEGVIIPELKGMSIEEAIKELERWGLKVGSVETKPHISEKGTILSQDPLPGTIEEKESSVNVIISQ